MADRAEAAKAQVHEKARGVDWVAQRDVAAVTGVACPSCGAKTRGGKSCPECGAAVAAKKRCNKCGAEADGNPKFCPECGQKYS